MEMMEIIKKEMDFKSIEKINSFVINIKVKYLF
jgi:hypothetical protein